MNKRELARQALRYLDSLKMPLPDESDNEFYLQNHLDYEALLTLNNKGFGASVRELIDLVNAPLTNIEVKQIVKRIIKIDNLVFEERAKEEKIESDPKYWDGYFSGYEASPTRRCEQLKRGINARVNRLGSEQSNLFKKITMQQAIDNNYYVDGMEESDFYCSESNS
jgi:hypothetical protein